MERLTDRLQPTGVGHYVRLSRVAHIINSRLGPGDLVVDAGGGKGLLGRLLRPDLKERYIVVDAVPAGFGIRIAADLAHIPLRDGISRAVVLSDVLEHLPDEGPTVAECWRLVARPCGHLIIHTPSKQQPAFKFVSESLHKAEVCDSSDGTTGHPFPHVRDGYSPSQLQGLIGGIIRRSVDVMPSFTRGQSLLADLDIWLKRRRLTALRAVTWLAIRARTQRKPVEGRTSAGLLARAEKP